MLNSCSRLVDDVASHVRLFKKARLALRNRNKDDGKIVDLVRNNYLFECFFNTSEMG